MATKKIEVTDEEPKFFDSSASVHENLPNTNTPMTGGIYDPTASEAEVAQPISVEPVVEGDDAE